MRKATGILLAAGLAFGGAAPFAFGGIAEGTNRGLRLYLTAGPALGSSGASYDFRYNPHPGYEVPGSYAGQTLRADSALGPELNAGLIIPLGRAVDLRLMGGWNRRPLRGANTPFEFLFKYTVWWPVIEPVQTSRFEATPWPPTFGSLDEASLGLELAAGFPVSRSLELALWAGPRLLFVSGRMGSLGFTEYIGSSHGAPFFRDYLLSLELSARTILGLSAGLEAGLRLADGLSLLLRAGYTAAGRYEAVPAIESAEIYWGLTPVDTQELKRIRKLLPLETLSLPLSRLSFAFGLALGL